MFNQLDLFEAELKKHQDNSTGLPSNAFQADDCQFINDQIKEEESQDKEFVFLDILGESNSYNIQDNFLVENTDFQNVQVKQLQWHQCQIQNQSQQGIFQSKELNSFQSLNIKEQKDIQKDIENEYEQCQQLEQILKSKAIQKQTNKNTNLPKFLIRVFMKYCGASRQLYQSKPQCFRELTKILKEFKNRKGNHFNLHDIISLMNDHQQVLQYGITNRLRMRKALRKNLMKQVMDNNYIRDAKNKVSYLNAAKVFALRMRNKELAVRIQSR